VLYQAELREKPVLKPLQDRAKLPR